MGKNMSRNNGLNQRDAKTGRFLTGSNGGPGRKVGSRNRLGEAFISDLHDEWQKSGAEALRRVARDDPVNFVKVTASLLPRLIDSTLSVDIDVFSEARTYAQAQKIALVYLKGEIEIRPHTATD